MSPLPKEQETDVGVFGFQAIKKIRGLLIEIDVQDQFATWEGAGQVVKVTTEDTVILEMFGDEEPFEIKTDNNPTARFSFLYPYKLTEGGKIKPGTPYHKCWMGSAKELGKVPSEFIGEYVTLEKQPRLLFQVPEMEDDGTGRKVPVLDSEGKKVLRDVLAVSEQGLPKYFCFVKDETADTDTVKAKVIEALVGLNEKAALRKLLVDFKNYPQFKDSLKAGTLADELGLTIVDGIFKQG